MSSFDNEFSDFHTLTKDETLKFFHTNEASGLGADVAAQRLKEIGENSLGDDSKIDYKAMIIHQLCNAMILVLFISMIISFAIHDWITGGVITFVVGVIVVMGLVQEY